MVGAVVVVVVVVVAVAVAVVVDKVSRVQRFVLYLITRHATGGATRQLHFNRGSRCGSSPGAAIGRPPLFAAADDDDPPPSTSAAAVDTTNTELLAPSSLRKGHQYCPTSTTINHPMMLVSG